MPHEIQFDADGHLYIVERDNHVVRRVDAATGIISTFVGTGTAGVSGDGGPASRAQLRSPHSVVVARAPRRQVISHIGDPPLRAGVPAPAPSGTFPATGRAM